MENVRIENGRWWFFGDGAEGVKWYDMGPSDEKCRNTAGNESDITVQEALEAGTLQIDEETGTPIALN